MRRRIVRRDGFILFAALWLTALFAVMAYTAQAKSAPGIGGEDADILSLGGAVTEIVVALDQGHRLLGRDTTSTHPPEVTELPDVGYVRALSPEGVLSVGPSLILSEEGAGPPEAIDVIRAAEVDFVVVPDAVTAQGILRKIAVIGDALGVPDKAADLAADVEQDLRRATEAAERPEGDKKRVMFVISTQGGRINASGTGTAADAMIRMAGGINAVAGYEGYKQITDEAVGLAAPDVIVMMDRGGDHAADDDALFAMPAVKLTPAAQSRSVIRMDGLLMLGFGPRTAEAVRRLNAALYGDGA